MTFLNSLRFLWIAVGVLVAGVVGAADLEEQRAGFRQALEALERGHTRTFKKLLEQLSDYPLKGYLEYEYLDRRLRKVSDETLRDFLLRYEDSPVSDRMRARWLYVLGKQGRWQTFIEEYREGAGRAVRCYYGQALFKTGRTAQAMAMADDLWLVGYSQPEQCDPVFDAWRAKGGMTREMVWGRINLGMDSGRLSLADYLAQFLNEDDQRWVARWREAHRNPADALKWIAKEADLPLTRRIARHAVKRLSRRDSGAAMSAWQSMRAKHWAHASERDEVADLDRYIALRGVYDQHPEALDWLGRIEAPDHKVRDWRIRAALAQRDWWSALTWIEALPPEDRKKPEWRYWRARILEMQSLTLPLLSAAAERIYASLSAERNYYGFMAADRLGVAYDLSSKPLEFEESELEAFERRPGIRRAYELMQLDMLGDARREWSYATSGLSDEELNVAAVVANRWGWHDRAILTVAKTEHWGDLELRFPIAYRDVVTTQAGSQGVDPAWVYGVLRQESLFMVDARSPAGALGLMQLMPGTGRLTARLLNSRLRSSWELLDADKNIRLGVAYLKRMLDKNDGHQVLATASYNAGPYRVEQWRPEKPTEADLWVETVPFTETRRYVRRVMAYTVIFEHRLNGEPERMQTRMPMILPGSG